MLMFKPLKLFLLLRYNSHQTSFIKGIAKLDGQLIILLDLTKVLSMEESTMLGAM
jgi:chemotaxis signal transduction protein